jgi:hypothetical protein
VKATRRAVVAASGAAALGLAGCTSDGATSTPPPTGSGESSATEPAAADPDQVALDRAVTITTDLLVALEGAPPGLDPARRLATLHTAHLEALQDATDASATPSAPVPVGPRLTAARLRRRELRAQGELARLAVAAESGALARLFASMSAGIAAAIAGRVRVVA